MNKRRGGTKWRRIRGPRKAPKITTGEIDAAIARFRKRGGIVRTLPDEIGPQRRLTIVPKTEGPYEDLRPVGPAGACPFPAD